MRAKRIPADQIDPRFRAMCAELIAKIVKEQADSGVNVHDPKFGERLVEILAPPLQAIHDEYKSRATGGRSKTCRDAKR